jgi:hypothetical protein
VTHEAAPLRLRSHLVTTCSLLHNTVAPSFRTGSFLQVQHPWPEQTEMAPPRNGSVPSPLYYNLSPQTSPVPYSYGVGLMAQAEQTACQVVGHCEISAPY